MTDDDLPALYVVADRLSNRGQRTTRNFVRGELWLLVAAAALGIGSWRIGDARLDMLAALGSIAFVAGGLLVLIQAAHKPEDVWYRGRAAAESTKSLAWLYAIGGNPFPLTAASADNRLLERFDELVTTLGDLELSGGEAVTGDQITNGMRITRAQPLSGRRAAYRDGRICTQMEWYRARSATHGRSAKRWAKVVIFANGAGAIFGALRFLGWIDVDMLGVAAAVAGAGTAWTQLLQHRALAASYAVAVQDLALVRDKMVTVPDDAWPRFVNDAEEAISREHTMWLARRGIVAGVK